MDIWVGEGADSERKGRGPVVGVVMIEKLSFGERSVVAKWEGN